MFCLIEKVIGPKNKIVEDSCYTWMLPFVRKDVVLLTSCTVSVMSHFVSSMDGRVFNGKKGKEEENTTVYFSLRKIMLQQIDTYLVCGGVPIKSTV